MSLPGAGYTSFGVSLTGGGGAGATAVASGGVDVVTVADGGSGYTMPTVDFDLPDAPDGVQARGSAQIDGNGTVTGVTVTDPGAGYTTRAGGRDPQWHPVRPDRAGRRRQHRLRDNDARDCRRSTCWTSAPATPAHPR